VKKFRRMYGVFARKVMQRISYRGVASHSDPCGADETLMCAEFIFLTQVLMDLKKRELLPG
jgi:hypothetical protein